MKSKSKVDFKRKIQNIIIFGFIGAMILVLLAPAFTVKAEGTEKLAVHFIDVGQGDATLITLDDSTTDGIDHAMLIDGGNYEDASKMYSYMTSYGLTNLDYMIATCTDEDHVGGLCGALAYSTPAVVLAPVATSDAHDYTTFTSALDKKFLKITIPEVGSEYSFGNASFKVLAPATTGDSNSEKGSIVIRFTYQNNSFLFMSDAGIDEEHAMVSSFDAASLKSDVIKVGTHGASRSTSDELLEAVAPSYAIISVGANNEYGYPASDTLTKFANKEVPVIRTDNSGDIIITSDGTNLSFNTQKDTDVTSSSGTTNGETSSTAPSLNVTPEAPGTEEEGLARYNDVLRMMQALMDASTDTSNISVDYFNTCMTYLAAYPIPIRQSAYVNASAAITSSAQMSNELAEACFYYLYHAELISNSDESLRDSAKIAEDTSKTMAELYQSQGRDVFYGRSTYSVSDLLDGNPYYSDMNPENDNANGAANDNTTTEPENVGVTTDSRTTGDASNMMLYIVMVAASLLIFSAVVYSSVLERRK